MNFKSFILSLVLIITLCIVGVFYFTTFKSVFVDEPLVVACTQEAKICPDGSSVSRQGEKCEFAECPLLQQEETKAALNQKIFTGGIFITPLEVVSDSRCPADVVCVWAGEVILKVKLENGTTHTDAVLKLQSPVVFDTYKVTLTGVTPENNSKTPFEKSDYRFTFLVTPLSAPVTATGTISGQITLSPTCPVERIPPDPQCSPKPYATTIEIREAGKEVVVKTIQSNNLGEFDAKLPVGTYELRALTVGGALLPRCSAETVIVTSDKNTSQDISCDTGIR